MKHLFYDYAWRVVDMTLAEEMAYIEKPYREPLKWLRKFTSTKAREIILWEELANSYAEKYIENWKGSEIIKDYLKKQLQVFTVCMSVRLEEEKKLALEKWRSENPEDALRVDAFMELRDDWQLTEEELMKILISSFKYPLSKFNELCLEYIRLRSYSYEWRKRAYLIHAETWDERISDIILETIKNYIFLNDEYEYLIERAKSNDKFQKTVKMYLDISIKNFIVSGNKNPNSEQFERTPIEFQIWVYKALWIDCRVWILWKMSALEMLNAAYSERIDKYSYSYSARDTKNFYIRYMNYRFGSIEWFVDALYEEKKTIEFVYDVFPRVLHSNWEDNTVLMSLLDFAKLSPATLKALAICAADKVHIDDNVNMSWPEIIQKVELRIKVEWRDNIILIKAIALEIEDRIEKMKQMRNILLSRKTELLNILSK